MLSFKDWNLVARVTDDDIVKIKSSPKIHSELLHALLARWGRYPRGHLQNDSYYDAKMSVRSSLIDLTACHEYTELS